MTKKTLDILNTVIAFLEKNEYGICSDIRISDLFPCVSSDFVLEGVWLFYLSHINEIFNYTGVPCDLVYMIDRDPDKFVYLYRLE